MIARHPKITDSHLRRRALHYRRQSTEQQVEQNVGSAAVQMDMAQQLEALGWPLDRQDFVDDPGVSASVPGLRPGFRTIIDFVTAGTHGIVGVSDVTRLTRNNPDCINLIEPAKAHHVLIAIGQQIFDPRDPTDEFMLLILCANSGRDRRTVSEFNTKARREKAKKGIATTRPPAGYITIEGGARDKTPDLRVQEVMQIIWDKALELRSAGAVVRFLRWNGIKVPRSAGKGTVTWIEATRYRILLILRNEAYAGTLVYGKTKADPFKPRYPKGRVRVARRPESEWVRVENHHPAYVSLADWRALQQTLSANRQRLTTAAGRGEALLQGALRCVTHNRKFMTTYPTRRRIGGRLVRIACYRCVDSNGTGEYCTEIHAHLLDPVIEQELLAVLAPPSEELLRQTLRQASQEYEALSRQRGDEINMAERRVANLQRHLVDVGPGRPHVQQRLADQLEEAGAALADLRAQHRRHPLLPPVSFDEAQLLRLRGLLENLPALWRHPAVMPEQRKAIVRAAIKVIDVRPGPQHWALAIEWVGGARTCLDMPTGAGVKALVSEAYRSGRTAEEITDALNGLVPGRRTGPQAGSPYTVQTVRAMIRRLELQQPFSEEACKLIRAGVETPGMTYRHISDALNAQAIRHYLGWWTPQRVAAVVKRLRKGRVPGVEPLAGRVSYEPALRALHPTGASASQLAAELRRQGFMTRHRRPVSAVTVYHALKRLGLPSNATAREQQLRAFLHQVERALSVREVTRRVNARRFLTRLGTPWTENAMARKLASLGLRTPQKRKPRRRGAGENPGGLPRQMTLIAFADSAKPKALRRAPS